MIPLVKQEHFPILFFFRNLKMRLRDASCKHFGKRLKKIQQALAEARFLRGENRIKKEVVSQSGDCKMTTLWKRNRFLKVTIWRLPFGGTFWLAGFAGRRFLVLIIKVTLSELSEASAPSTSNL